MNFKLSSEHEAARDTVKRLCREALSRLLELAGKLEQFAQPVIRRWVELGLIGVNYLEDAGGSGLDKMNDCIVREKLNHVSQVFDSYGFAGAQLGIWPVAHLADLKSRSCIPERLVSEIGDAWPESLGVCFD